MTEIMRFFLSPKPIPQALERLRIERGRKLSVRISVIAVFIGAFGVVIESIFGQPFLALGDALIPVGALISYGVSKRVSQDRSRSTWIPLYFFYWVGAGFTIYATGGLKSPHIVPYMVLLFIAGTFFEVRLSPRHVLYFCLLNLVGWTILSILGIPSNAPAVGSTYMVLIRNLLFLAGALMVLDQFFELEEILALESEEQAKKFKEAQSALAHAEKMAQVGNLVATTAHEFAQPVQVITMSSAMIKRMMRKPGDSTQPQDSGPEALRQFAENIYEASLRLARLLGQLRAFSRKDPYQAKRFDCRMALQAIETMIRFDLEGRGLKFTVSLPSEPVEIFGDLMKVQQILFNLIGNARDAALQTPNPVVEVTLRRREPDWVRICVRNSGPGIPIADQKKIFEPYFTTKKLGEGTGLGLAVCADLVAQHKGQIFFCSDEGETTFMVDLPQTDLWHGQRGRVSPEPATVRASS